MAEETITAQTPEIDPGMSVMPEAPGLMDVPTVIPELGLAAQALASQVSFAKKTWKDGSGGGTPITAAELNRLEQGVADLTSAVNALRDSVSQLNIIHNAVSSGTSELKLRVLPRAYGRFLVLIVGNVNTGTPLFAVVAGQKNIEQTSVVNLSGTVAKVTSASVADDVLTVSLDQTVYGVVDVMCVGGSIASA